MGAGPGHVFPNMSTLGRGCGAWKHGREQEHRGERGHHRRGCRTCGHGRGTRQAREWEHQTCYVLTPLILFLDCWLITILFPHFIVCPIPSLEALCPGNSVTVLSRSDTHPVCVEVQWGKGWLVAEYRPVSKNYILCSGRYLPEYRPVSKNWSAQVYKIHYLYI